MEKSDLISIIESNGFIQHTLSFNGNGERVLKTSYSDPRYWNAYNTMTGPCEYFFKKEGNETTIRWGLNQKGYGPTLIYPRPKVNMYCGGKLLTEEFDKAVIRCIEDECPKEIFDAMFDESIIFNYGT